MRVVSEMLCTSLPTRDSLETPGQVLRDCYPLQMYLLTKLETIVSSHNSLTVLERERHLPHLRKVARVLYVECCQQFDYITEGDEREINRLRLCLTLLRSIFSLLPKYHFDKLECSLKEITNESASKSMNSLVSAILKRLQATLVTILDHEDARSFLKDATTIVEIMTQVAHLMDHEYEELEVTYEWTVMLCKERGDIAESSSLVEELLKFVLFLANQLKSRHNTMHHIAKDVYYCLGDAVEDVSIRETDISFQVIKDKSVSCTVSVLMNEVDSALAHIEMSINKMKAYLVTNAEYNAQKIEENINIKLGVIIKTMNEIYRATLPEPVRDLILKKSEKIYNTLSLFVRYYLDLFRIKTFPQISEKFERLVLMSGELLSDPLYRCLDYIEDARSTEGVNYKTALKESKLIPALVFSIENYEKFLIQLSKKSKVDLMRGMKLSTLRDFRIEKSKLDGLRKNDEDGEEEEKEPASGSSKRKLPDGDENSQLKKKKKKVKS